MALLPSWQFFLQLLLKVSSNRCFTDRTKLIHIRQLANFRLVVNAWLRTVVVGVLQPKGVCLVTRSVLLVVNRALFHGSLDLALHALVLSIAEAVKFIVLIAIGVEPLTTTLVPAFAMELSWVVL